MEKPERPRCKKQAKSKQRVRNTSRARGAMAQEKYPPLQAIVENEITLALSYREDTGQIKKFNMTLSHIHASNRKVCEKGGAKQLQAESKSIKRKACPREDERVK